MLKKKEERRGTRVARVEQGSSYGKKNFRKCYDLHKRLVISMVTFFCLFFQSIKKKIHLKDYIVTQTQL